MKKILVIAALAALGACDKNPAPAQEIDRPAPPNVVAEGNARAPSVAVDFIKKYSAVVQAAIDRTPYNEGDPNAQMRIAQSLFKADSEHLQRWVDTGVALFDAAHDQTCKIFVISLYNAWKEAYPLNGPPIAADLEGKKKTLAFADSQRTFCLHHTTLPIWGT